MDTLEHSEASELTAMAEAGAAYADATGTLVEVDATAAALLGAAAADIVGTAVADRLAVVEGQGWDGGDSGALARWQGVAVVRGSDPPRRLLVARLRLPGAASVWSFKDASAEERRRAKLTSRLMALDASFSGIAMADTAGALTYVNASFLEMWGHASADEVLGRSATDFWVAPEEAATVLQRTLRGAGWRGELVALRADGEEFIVELSASLITDGAGAPIAVLGSFVDVTERHRATSARRSEQERLRQAVRVAHLGIFDHDHRADSVYWSARQRAIYGFTADEEVTLEKFLACVHPDDLERIGGAVARAHSSASDGLFDAEHRILRRDGAVRWVKTRSQTFFDEDRALVRTVGAVMDVTEERRAADERERLQVRLAHAQRLESIGLLAGGVAHDFNNMLAVILGNAELMRTRVVHDALLAEDLADVVVAAEHARDVTRQLLTFSRRQVVEARPIAVNDVLGKATSALGRLLGEDVVLEFLPGDDLWTIEMDPSQLEHVLMNLATNARDAMPRGGRITVETANVRIDESYCRNEVGFEPGDYVLLVVSDTGTGMDPETVERVFEPFFTTKEMGHGTGLGLSTVHGIVTQAHGIVHVGSEPGVGTTFKIYLPRLDVDGLPALFVDDATAVVEPGTVLLVEDEPLVRKMTTAMLSSLGLTVIVAQNPHEALEVAGGDAHVDLLLTDVVMPEMSGPTLRQRVGAVRPTLPVLFMSGYAPNIVVHHGVLDDVQLLQKPFTLRDLAAAIRSARGDA
ncbi:MAG: hybrid sensor histidine kinase/response regulator [Deltaproteobacteria bacterium HGW-Deltaproteobacteria-14]|jgi:PAS domain S-box-containing protein|nr:MAG: hybrid sensor histidine kinase/response regulator [Deltaproteobacteria bacterium HGW-Deltaproteobacteria-14]